jgi:hypothetical protein
MTTQDFIPAGKPLPVNMNVVTRGRDYIPEAEMALIRGERTVCSECGADFTDSDNPGAALAGHIGGAHRERKAQRSKSSKKASGARKKPTPKAPAPAPAVEVPAAPPTDEVVADSGTE